MNTQTYIPHREQLPRRYCACGTLLSTGNETPTCWACGKTWCAIETELGQLIGAEICEAIDRILAEAQ